MGNKSRHEKWLWPENDATNGDLSEGQTREGLVMLACCVVLQCVQCDGFVREPIQYYSFHIDIVTEAIFRLRNNVVKCDPAALCSFSSFLSLTDCVPLSVSHCVCEWKMSL